MKSITFSCEETLAMPPEEVARQILDLDRWPGFEGYGPLPGIRAAEFEARTPEVVGTRIRVTNTDGSSHVEEIVTWEPDRRLRLRMGEFSPPLSRLATGFDETWEFERTGEADEGRPLLRAAPEIGRHPAAALADLRPAEAGHRPSSASDARCSPRTCGGLNRIADTRYHEVGTTVLQPGPASNLGVTAAVGDGGDRPAACVALRDARRGM